MKNTRTSKIEFSSHGFWRRFYAVKLTTGDDLAVDIGRKHCPNCRFVKVTRKAFNILNLDTNRCLLRHHLYAKGMANKEFPSKGPITGVFTVSDYVRIRIKEKQMDKSA